MLERCLISGVVVIVDRYWISGVVVIVDRCWISGVVVIVDRCWISGDFVKKALAVTRDLIRSHYDQWAQPGT